MRRRKGTLVRWAFWLAAGLAAFVSWWQFLWPPVAFYEASPSKPDGFEILGELLKPKNAIYEEPLFGWAFLCLSIIFGLFLIHFFRGIANYLENSRVGISMLDTSWDIEMQDAARTAAVIRRKQTFHANRRGITAYKHETSTDTPTGAIDRKSITQQSTVGNRTITKELLLRGGPSSIEVIELFDRELPTSLLATYLPNWLVCALHGAWLFDSVVVNRTGSMTLLNEFNGPDGVYTVNSTKHPISRTIIRISFVRGHEPAKIRGFLIRENVVEEVALTTTTTQTHTVYEAKASSLHREGLRVQWAF